MISALGSPSTPGIAAMPGSSTAGIEAQLARYRNELSNCVNCTSANTLEGQAAIAEAASKVSVAEARIESIAASSQSSAPAASQGSSTGASTSSTASDASAKAYEGALTYERPVSLEPSSGTKLSAAPAGTLINVFA
jgi:hypothetical protein